MASGSNTPHTDGPFKWQVDKLILGSMAHGNAVN